MGGSAVCSLIAFGIEPDSDEATAAAPLMERRYAEGVLRMSLEAAKASPVDWFRHVYPSCRDEIARFTGRFTPSDAVANAETMALLRDIVAWADKNLNKKQVLDLARFLEEKDTEEILSRHLPGMVRAEVLWALKGARVRGEIDL